MRRLPTRLAGLALLAPRVHGDARGFFVETWRADGWADHGVPTEFVQDNQSRSRRGTLRGIHFQTQPGQGKLVRVARGRVLDVVVDLRRDSPTFGEWEGAYYDPATEAGIRFDDPDVGIAWPDIELICSERDRSAPRLAEIDPPF
jgi:dTDP-4-dehydrorhamnose 3,5-epimerase